MLFRASRDHPSEPGVQIERCGQPAEGQIERHVREGS
jgi:hypothetical protein